MPRRRPTAWRLLLCLLVIYSQWLTAQSPRRIFEQVGAEYSGRTLAGASPQDLLIDRQGRLWYGTWGQGLIRFDGYNLRYYQYDAFDSTSLSINRISQIREDSKGYIWAATLEGLNRLDVRTGRFTRYYLPTSGGAQVTASFELSDHTVLVGEAHGLWELDTDTRQWTRWKPLDGSDPEKSPLVGAMLRDRKGQIWADCASGLLRLIPEKKSFEVIPCRARNAPKDLACTGIMQDRRGQIWVGTRAGLLRFFPDDQRFEPSGLPDSLGMFLVNNVVEDVDGSFWIGFAQRGLAHWMPGSADVEHYRHLPNQPFGLTDDQIAALSLDRIGNLWIGNGANINKINTRPPNFRLFQLESRQPDYRNRIYWTVEDERGGLLMHTKSGVFYSIALGATPEPVSLPSGKNLFTFANGITRAPDGKLWAAWQQGGLSEWLPDSRSFRPVLRDTSFGKNLFIGICHDRDNPDVVWMGLRSGLARFNKKTSEHQVFVPAVSQEGNLTVGEIEDDGHGGLWFDLAGGMGFFNKKTGRFSAFRHDEKDPAHSLVNNDVLDISPAPDGSVWVGTSGGMSHITRTANETGDVFAFQNLTKRDGLRHNMVQAVVATLPGQVWFGALEDVVLLETNTSANSTNSNPPTSTNLGKNELLSPEARSNSKLQPLYRLTFFNIATTLQCGLTVRKSFFHSTTSGLIYAAGNNGLVTFDPTLLSRDQTKPVVLLTEIFVNNQPADLPQEPEYTDFLSLGPNQNALAFEFAGVHLAAPVFNQYAYRLDGYDTAWVYCGNLRRAAYTNLAPGTYVFRVKAANADGIWNEEGTQLRFAIAPPFWQSKGFRFLLLLIASAIIYVVLYTRLQQRRLAQAKELAEQNARYKSQFLANMSHEIRTPMNAILGLSRLLDEQTMEPRQREYLGAIRHSSEDLLRIVNDILDHSKIESGQFTYQQKPFDLDVLLNHLRHTFEFRAHDKGIDFQIIKGPDVPTALEGDPVRLMQILTNLVSNAIKFTEIGGVTVEVWSLISPQAREVRSSEISGKASNSTDVKLDPTSNFSRLRRDQTLNFTVRDTGVGIPADKMDTVFESFSQVYEEHATSKGGTGLGLSIAKQLVEQQGGSIQLSSHVGEGTVMTFDLAFQRSALPPEVPDSSIPAALTTGLQHLRILLVEDTYFNQLLAIELLKSKIRDVEIDVAENGQIALDKLDAQSYDLVLMDVKMPVMDGLEATRRIRRHPDDRVRSLPVVGLTASAVKEELEKCRIAGMNRWVTKPIQTEELLEAIQETIPPDLATTQFFFS